MNRPSCIHSCKTLASSVQGVIQTLVIPCLAAVFLQTAADLRAEDTNDLHGQIMLLQQQNATLLQQLQHQQTLIDDLNHKVSAIEESSGTQPSEPSDNSTANGFNFGKLHLSGEGGAGLFASGPQGMNPNSEFRVDEARLFLDASVWDDTYVHAEVDLAQRQQQDDLSHLEELYVDFEDVSKLWGHDSWLNVRIGRMDIPFGEEYLNRFAIDNPLISHSLSDLWGVSEGAEIYGSAGKFSYVMAAQNGGYPDSDDFNGDKSIAARVAFDPNRKLHFSLSAMRTGDLDAQDNSYSALWFGNGWIESIGSPATTKFGAELLEADAVWRLPHGQFKAFGGYLHYYDNAPTANNQRDVYYYALEARQRIVGGLYAAARFSQIFAHGGFPVFGEGSYGDFYDSLTSQLWRLSLGLGYRFNENLLLKAEYSFERGEDVGGEPRDHEDLLAVEAAFQF